MIRSLQQQAILPENTRIQHISQAQTNYYRRNPAGRERRAVILGCKNDLMLSNCEAYISTINIPKKKYKWYKRYHKKQWIIELIFHNASYKDAFMSKYIQNRTPEVAELMIYTKNKGYEKLRNHQTSHRILKQLHHKIHDIIDRINNDPLKTHLTPIINKLIPQETFNQKLRADIEENIVDLFQIYNIINRTAPITTKKTLQEDTRPTALKILSKNIGGALINKLKSTSAFTLDRILYKPHIIMIQEHMLKNKTRKEFERIYKMRGYRLVLHSKAHKKHKNAQGRPSGGLAVWVTDAIAESYKIQSIRNTAYVQQFRLKPRNSQNKPIHITNAYCKPDWQIPQLNDFYQKIHTQTAYQDTTQIKMGDYSTL